MTEKFNVELCSDLDFEEMVVDITLGNHTIATVTQENGITKMEIEIYPRGDEVKTWLFHLDDFIEILRVAKQCLIETRNTPEDR